MGGGVLMLDGHPDGDRLTTHLLDAYAAALPQSPDRLALRDLDFDPVLHRGYAEPQPWEPDLEALWARIESCGHLVLAFPLWWGSEPALLTGLWQRLLLPGRAFRYHDRDPWWDRLMRGRSADVIVTMDTPPAYLRLAYFDPLGWRYRRQVLGFVGFRPLRMIYLGPVRRGGVQRDLGRWQARLARAARTIPERKSRWT